MSYPMVQKIKNFRERLFSLFEYRADASMELIDSLSSNTNADSVVKLSLNPLFRRGYSSITDVVDNFFKSRDKASNIRQVQIEQLLMQQCPPTSEARPFHLFALDTTPAPRQFASTLDDRGIVFCPNPVPGNKPITVGHKYSVLGYLPDKSSQKFYPPWLLPLSTRRVSTDSGDIEIGSQQLSKVLKFFSRDLTVDVADAFYSKPEFLKETLAFENHVHIARLRGNRIFNHKPKNIMKQKGPRHELWYGKEFSLKNENTWGNPNEEIIEHSVTRKGKILTIKIQCWDDKLLRQKRGIRMHENPFNVVRITTTDKEGSLVFKRPLWLMVSGKRRKDINLKDICNSYFQRYDIEHFFRFGKSRLLMDKFQTPELKHEEAWWQIVSLASAQLFLAKELTENMPNPWEKYLPQIKENGSVKSPSQVQKSFGKITAAIGTPASSPKPRGKQLGRAKGVCPPKRRGKSIVIKDKNKRKLMAA